VDPEPAEQGIEAGCVGEVVLILEHTDPQGLAEPARAQEDQVAVAEGFALEQWQERGLVGVKKPAARTLGKLAMP